MRAFDDIKSAKHIVIQTDNISFANANALYSYVLALHKKVSLVAIGQIDEKFSFLPWFSRVRDTVPKQADCIIEAEPDATELYFALKQEGVSINQKMATALFGALLEFTQGFSNAKCTGTAFVVAAELIELKAEHLTCKEFLQRREPLSLFRLKSILYKKMLQSDNAQVMNMYVSDEDLKSSGARLKDAEEIMKEVLKTVHVKEVRLYKSDENNKILKSIKEI
ncbi:phosphoesterase [Sulfurimonas sediminis]|uniref:Phosphoesterase n=1 Tax=Sulfurimonas sediminis TaxID=2590020 RepID=A0A7M1B083_9BACT|nr:phosphoesterase [Sulfurimonas sediminis]QOP43131.1 phosphoesterase [Sulfurimonas sediminis]